jgi:hypothetical protein
MLLKASDFAVHDLSAESVIEGCVDNDGDDDRDRGTTTRGGGGSTGGAEEGYKLELVLRKWFAIDPSREMRAFVRDGVLIGTCVHIHTCVCVSYPARNDRHIAA